MDYNAYSNSYIRYGIPASTPTYSHPVTLYDASVLAYANDTRSAPTAVSALSPVPPNIGDYVTLWNNDRFLRLDGNQASVLYTSVLSEVAWGAENVMVHGKMRTPRRLTSTQGDDGTRLRYAGIEKRNVPWTPFVFDIKQQIERVTGHQYNFVLCNYYPGGDVGLSWHADKVRDLTPGSTIASFSLGATRKFRMRNNVSEEVTEFRLYPGTLLVMKDGCQERFKHGVPEEKKVKEPRINLTFRHVKVAY